MPSRLLAVVPAPRSPRWLRVFGVGTVLLAGGLVAAGAINRGSVTGQVVVNVTLVSASIVAVLSGLGFVGARVTFLGGAIGLAVGYAQMVWGFAASRDGFGDLAALAGFLMLGTIGFGVGVVIDVVRWVWRRRRSAQGVEPPP